MPAGLGLLFYHQCLHVVPRAGQCATHSAPPAHPGVRSPDQNQVQVPGLLGIRPPPTPLRVRIGVTLCTQSDRQSAFPMPGVGATATARGVDWEATEGCRPPAPGSPAPRVPRPSPTSHPGSSDLPAFASRSRHAPTHAEPPELPPRPRGSVPKPLPPQPVGPDSCGFALSGARPLPALSPGGGTTAASPSLSTRAPAPRTPHTPHPEGPPLRTSRKESTGLRIKGQSPGGAEGGQMTEAEVAAPCGASASIPVPLSGTFGRAS